MYMDLALYNAGSCPYLCNHVHNTIRTTPLALNQLLDLVSLPNAAIEAAISLRSRRSLNRAATKTASTEYYPRPIRIRTMTQLALPPVHSHQKSCIIVVPFQLDCGSPTPRDPIDAFTHREEGPW